MKTLLQNTVKFVMISVELAKEMWIIVHHVKIVTTFILFLIQGLIPRLRFKSKLV